MRGDFRRRKLLAAGGATLLGGCEALNRDRAMRPGFQFDADPALGGVIGSIETFGPFAYAAGRSYVALYAADVLKEDGTPRQGVHLIMDMPNATADGRLLRAPTGLWGYDFEMPYRTPVRLFAAALPEREYVVTSFTYQWSTLPRIGTTWLPPIRFRPRAGTVTYVGSLGFVPHSDNFVRAIALRDESERDLPRLREQFDWLQRRQIDVRIPNAPGWPRQMIIPQT